MDMETTFLIGNGFDLNLGLKTRYTDFYPHYVDDSRFDSDDPAVLSFKELLQRDGNYRRWADFERALGAHTKKPPLNEEATLRRCLWHFKRCFAQYLKEEDQRINLKACGAEMMRRFASGLCSHLDWLEPRDSAALEDAFRIKGFAQYNILNFNYTTIIDRLVSDYQDPGDDAVQHLKQIIHVHGTYSSGMLIGLDNASQAANPNLLTNPRQQRLLLKPLVNQQSGHGNDQAAWDCINKSDEICIFGMSLGETDAVWWRRIGNWLQDTVYHHLVIFALKRDLDLLFWDDIIEYQEEIRDRFFSRAELPKDVRNRLRDQVHVSLNAGIFNLEPVHGRYPHPIQLDMPPCVKATLLS